MWAYALTSPKYFEKVEAPTPSEGDLRDGQVLLRTLAGGICGSDLPAFAGHGGPRTQFQGAYAPNYPGFPMHEIVGEVLASRSPLFAKGAHVVGWAENADAVAEFCITGADSLAQVDADLDPATAILIQTLACVIFAVDRIGDVEGESVVVLGLGPIGVLFGHVLKARGAAHVTGVDLIDRHDIAADFGFDAIIHGSTDRWSEQVTDADRPTIVVEAIGHQHLTLTDAINGVATNGRIYYFGIPEIQPVSFDLFTFLRKSLLLQAGTTQSRHQALEVARDHLKSHPFLAEQYVTNVFDVAEVQQAYDMANTPSPGRLKVALRMA